MIIHCVAVVANAPQRVQITVKTNKSRTMKTVLQIKQLQEDARQEMQDIKALQDLSKKIKDRRIKSLSDKIAWFQKGINYLESEPADAYITITLSQLKEDINHLQTRVGNEMKQEKMPPLLNGKEYTKRCNQCGVDTKKKQLKFLTFIYSDN